MTLTTQRADLLAAVQTVAQAVSPNPQTPILSAILLRANNSTLELQATDYELGISATIPATFDVPGADAVPGLVLRDVVKTLAGDTVSVEPADNTLAFSSAGTRFALLHMLADAYPQLQKLDDGSGSFAVKGSVLLALIRRVRFACAKDESRPTFTGCLFEVEGDSVRMAATNAHRMATGKAALGQDVGGKRQFIIPARAFDVLASAVKDEDTVAVTCTPQQMAFEFGGLYVTTRLIEGQFPDVKRNIPATFATTATLDRDAFLAALGRVDLIAKSLNYNVVRLTFEGGSLRLRAVNKDVGEAVEDVPATIEGEPLTIAFNGRYVAEAVKRFDAKEFTFNLNAPNMAAALREVGGGDYDYIVTPVRLHD